MRWVHVRCPLLHISAESRHLLSSLHVLPTGDGSVDRAFSQGDAIVYGTRYFSLSYDITTTSSNLANCPFVKGGRFCAMQVCMHGVVGA